MTSAKKKNCFRGGANYYIFIMEGLRITCTEESFKIRANCVKDGIPEKQKNAVSVPSPTNVFVETTPTHTENPLKGPCPLPSYIKIRAGRGPPLLPHTDMFIEENTQT